MVEAAGPSDKNRGREEIRKPGTGPLSQEPVPEMRTGNRRSGPRFDEYAPLVATPSRILMTIEKHPMLRCPRTYSEVPRKSPAAGSFCRFHNDYSHATDDCQHLKDEIERLIRGKNLPEFVKPAKTAARMPLRAEPQPQVGGQRMEARGEEPLGNRTDPPPRRNYISMIH